MNADERRACDGLDDASIMETMEWLKEQCILLHFQIESAGKMIADKRVGAEMPLPSVGGSEG
jgi:hypothetical protein